MTKNNKFLIEINTIQNENKLLLKNRRKKEKDVKNMIKNMSLTKKNILSLLVNKKDIKKIIKSLEKENKLYIDLINSNTKKFKNIKLKLDKNQKKIADLRIKALNTLEFDKIEDESDEFKLSFEKNMNDIINQSIIEDEEVPNTDKKLKINNKIEIKEIKSSKNNNKYFIFIVLGFLLAGLFLFFNKEE
tara:strand:+ start:334 stop:900 length:567 start_codon:yes stop_codon:yes gene_type:complete